MKRGSMTAGDVASRWTVGGQSIEAAGSRLRFTDLPYSARVSNGFCSGVSAK